MIEPILVLIVAFVSLLIAQLIKAFNVKKFDLFSLKGIVSSHSAVVSSIAAFLFLRRFDVLAAVVLVFAIIVIRDSFARHKLKEIIYGVVLGVIVGVFFSFL